MFRLAHYNPPESLSNARYVKPTHRKKRHWVFPLASTSMIGLCGYLAGAIFLLQTERFSDTLSMKVASNNSRSR